MNPAPVPRAKISWLAISFGFWFMLCPTLTNAQAPSASPKSETNSASESKAPAASAKQSTKPEKREWTAKDYYDDGVAAFDGAEFRLAVTQLKKAIQLDPGYVDAHYKLGASYFRLRQFTKAWKKFRDANQLDPEHKRALFGFSQMWAYYETAGVLRVGQNPHRVMSILGKPDEEIARGSRKQFTYNFMTVDFVNNRLFLVLDSRDFTTDKAIALSKIDFSFDSRDWNLITRKVSKKHAVQEFVPAGQSPRRSSERVKIQRAIGIRYRGTTAKRFVATLRAALKRQNPDLVWNVISVSDNDVLFEWRNTKTDEKGKETGSHSLSRAIGGEKDVHVLTYRKGVPKMGSTQRALWIDRLRGAKLVPLKKKSSG